jgi:hypothetical protein
MQFTDPKEVWIIFSTFLMVQWVDTGKTLSQMMVNQDIALNFVVHYHQIFKS